MIQATELLLVALVALLIFGIGGWGHVSRRLARLRLHYEKGLAEEAMIEEGPVEGDEEKRGGAGDA